MQSLSRFLKNPRNYFEMLEYIYFKIIAERDPRRRLGSPTHSRRSASASIPRLNLIARRYGLRLIEMAGTHGFKPFDGMALRGDFYAVEEPNCQPNADRNRLLHCDRQETSWNHVYIVSFSS
jgi:hypothetical protein